MTKHIYQDGSSSSLLCVCWRFSWGLVSQRKEKVWGYGETAAPKLQCLDLEYLVEYQRHEQFQIYPPVDKGPLEGAAGQGQIEGVQVLDPDLLKAALQGDPDDRGVQIDRQRMYNNAFWANRYTKSDGFDCEFWVPQMLGVSGNVVALMPNGTTYYYFSDNQEFTWDAALRQSDRLIPFCPPD